MAKTNIIESGNVKVELRTADGVEEVTLLCSLDASKRISRVFGGFMPAFRQLQTYDESAYVAIIAAGLDKTAAEVEDRIFYTGLPNLVGPLVDYLNKLMHGGVAPDDDNKLKTAAA